MIEDPTLLRGPTLVAWLVKNTEDLVLVAAALEQKAADFGPSVSPESVVQLCKTTRHAALEVTVALLGLISRSDGPPATSALAEAVAHVHSRLQRQDLEG